jgi:hypothetical protein
MYCGIRLHTCSGLEIPIAPDLDAIRLSRRYACGETSNDFANFPCRLGLVLLRNLDALTERPQNEP